MEVRTSSSSYELGLRRTQLYKEYDAELIVLARYMQIISSVRPPLLLPYLKRQHSRASGRTGHVRGAARPDHQHPSLRPALVPRRQPVPPSVRPRGQAHRGHQVPSPFHLPFLLPLTHRLRNSHFVTANLDEGPIIEQDVTRVSIPSPPAPTRCETEHPGRGSDHSLNPKSLTSVGSSVENVVLGRAVKWVAERRVLLNGNKTVVFT